MTIETATYIGQLDPTLPLGTDPKSEGDDHLRMIKKVLQNTFPSANGPAPVGSVRTVAEGSATAGQTVINIQHTVGLPLDLFVGGAALSTGDYTDTDPTFITLAKAMSVGTQYKVAAYYNSAGFAQNNPRTLVEGDATAGMTDIVIPGGCIPGLNDVYVSGIIQQKYDYDDSSGTTIKLKKGMAAGTAYKAICYSPGMTVQPVGGQLTGFRNKFINGDFRIAQRGTTFNDITGGTFKYTLDRWQAAGLGASSISVSQQLFTLAESGLNYGGIYYMNATVTNGGSAAGDAAFFQQSIEDVRTLAGKTVTISGYVFVDKANSLTIELAQFFGSGGGATPEIDFGYKKFTFAASGWYPLSWTVAVPALTNSQTISGTDSRLTFTAWLSAGSNWNARTGNLGFQTGGFLFSKLQIEPGNVATQFEDRPLGTEFDLCKRYCVVYPPSAFIGPAAVMSNTDAHCMFLGTDKMRVLPGVTWGAGGGPKLYTGGASYPFSTWVGAYFSNGGGYAAVFRASGSLSSGWGGALYSESSAIILSSEL